MVVDWCMSSVCSLCLLLSWIIRDYIYISTLLLCLPTTGKWCLLYRNESLNTIVDTVVLSKVISGLENLVFQDEVEFTATKHAIQVLLVRDALFTIWNSIKMYINDDVSTHYGLCVVWCCLQSYHITHYRFYLTTPSPNFLPGKKAYSIYTLWQMTDHHHATRWKMSVPYLFQRGACFVSFKSTLVAQTGTWILWGRTVGST